MSETSELEPEVLKVLSAYEKGPLTMRPFLAWLNYKHPLCGVFG